eukprot:scaffold48_cov311-Pinguiococcus_pyrenoidosus.AAC.273
MMSIRRRLPPPCPWIPEQHAMSMCPPSRRRWRTARMTGATQGTLVRGSAGRRVGGFAIPDQHDHYVGARQRNPHSTEVIFSLAKSVLSYNCVTVEESRIQIR